MGVNHSCDRETFQKELEEKENTIKELGNQLEKNQCDYDITLKDTKLNLYPHESIKSKGSEIHCHPFIKNTDLTSIAGGSINFVDAITGDSYATADQNTTGDYTKISDILPGALDSSLNIIERINVCPGDTFSSHWDMDHFIETQNKLPKVVSYHITSNNCNVIGKK